MPSYRIIVTEHARSPKTGNIVEKVGTYNPKTKERILNAERIKYWLSVGAKASGTMHNMLISVGIIEGKKINVLPKKSPPKKEEAPAPELNDEVKPAVPDSTSSSQAEETPATEVSKE